MNTTMKSRDEVAGVQFLQPDGTSSTTPSLTTSQDQDEMLGRTRKGPHSNPRSTFGVGMGGR